MIELLSVASLALSAPWFALSIAGGRPGCVEVKWVQPDGPAGHAGLHDGDCIVQVDGKTVSTSDDLIKALGETRPNRTTTLGLSHGRAIQVVPTKRTREAERTYCEYRATRFIRIRVLIVRAPDDGEEANLSLPGVATLGEIRKQLAANGRARVFRGSACDDPQKAPVVMDDAAESTAITDGTVIHFGFDNMTNISIWRIESGDHTDGG